MGLERQLAEQLQGNAQTLCDELLAAEAAFADDEKPLQAAVDEALRLSLFELDRMGLQGPANQLPSSEFWRVAEPVLSRGSLQLHARSKPCGYAGDYQLLDRICRHDISGESIGRAMDVFFQNQAAPHAVRNRCREIAGTIHQVVEHAKPTNRIHLLSVGSGPAWEVKWAFDDMKPDQRSRVNLTLLDIDPRGLEFCRSLLSDLVDPDRLTTKRLNLGRLPRSRKFLESLEKYDLVYCAGFFDYLNDKDAMNMLRVLWELVADDGCLLVFNFSDQNPSQPYMEWIGNWYLTYRSNEALHSLADEARLDRCKFFVDFEPAGVNLFLRCRKIK